MNSWLDKYRNSALMLSGIGIPCGEDLVIHLYNLDKYYCRSSCYFFNYRSCFVYDDESISRHEECVLQKLNFCCL